MKVVVFSQARIDSTRLPGKVLKIIAGRTLLEYHIERVKSAKKVDLHCIVTSDESNDEGIVIEAEKLGVKVQRGSKLDVLGRFKTAAEQLRLNENDLIIRLTADCPLVDPVLIDSLVAYYQACNCDYANIDITTIPRGFDAEIFNVGMLYRANKEAKEAYQREHVTPYFYQNQDKFTCSKLAFCPVLHPEFRLCVDEPSDFEVIQHVVEWFSDTIFTVSSQDIVAFLAARPEVAKINADIKQKQLGQ